MARGGRRPGAGRPKGSANKITREARSMVKLVVEENLPELRKWFAKSWKDDGHQAARLLERLMDFGAPRLARAEIVAPIEERPLEELTDSELARLAVGDSTDAEEVAGRLAEMRGDPPAQGREATAEDLGMGAAAPEPARRLPAPAPQRSAEAKALPPPVPLEAQGDAAQARDATEAARPLEGELMPPRFRTRAEREAFEAERMEKRAIAERRERDGEARLAVSEWERRREEYLTAMRLRRRDPNLQLSHFAIVQAIGPRPPGPGL